MSKAPETLLQRLADVALRLCRADSAGVCILETRGREECLQWRAVAGTLAGLVDIEVPRDRSACGVVLATNAPQLFIYPERHYTNQAVDDHPTVEKLLVPFREGEKAVGTLWVATHGTTRLFDLEDQRILTTLAGLTSGAYQIKRSLERSGADVDAIKRLHRLGTQLVEEHRIDRLLHEILDTAIAIGEADFGNIQLFDPESGELKIVAQRGFPQWWVDHRDAVRPGRGSCGTALARGERVIVEDVRQSPLFADPERLAIQLRAEVLAVQSTPLVSRSGKLLGMFSTHRRKPGRPDERALNLLDLLAWEAAELIHHTQTETAMRRVEDRFRALVETTSATTWTANADGSRMKDLSSWRAFSGQTEEEVQYGGWTRVVHPDDLTTALKKWDDSVRCGLPYWNEQRLRRHDGQWRWMGIHAVPIRDADGRVIEWVGMNFDITERKVAEEAVREGRTKLKAAMEGMSDAVFIADAEARLVDFNDAYAKMHRFADRDACLLALEDYPAVLEGFFPDGKLVPLEMWPLSKALRGESGMAVEYHLHRKDTDQRWIGSYNFAPIHDDQGRIVGAVVVGRDITEKKATEEAVREGRAKLRAAMESMSDAVFITDADGQFVDFNDAYAKVHRFPNRDACLRALYDYPAILDCYFPDGTFAPLEQWAVPRALRGEAVMEAEYHLHRKDTGERWIGSYSFAPIRDAKGEIVGSVVVGRDITERKRIEAELHHREARLRAILNSATDAIISIDDHGVVLNANTATERMFGYKEADLIGRNIKMLMPPPYRDEHDDYLRNYLRTGEKKVVGRTREATARRKDGELFPVELSIAEIDGERQFTGFIRDISERLRLQRHLLNAASEEQHRLSCELHDGIQQEMTGLSLFAGTVCKKVQDLVASNQDASLGLSAVRGLLPAEALRLLQEVAERLANGLSETYRHVQQLAHGISPVPTDADGLKVSLQGLAAGVAPGVSCRFVSIGDVTLRDNHAASNVYRIAQEALNNALRHGHASVVKISLAEEDGKLVLQVADNGSGFDPAKVAHGMGLQTMDYRANMIGGRLKVDSSRDGGTTIRCIFPRHFGAFPEDSLLTGSDPNSFP